MKSPVKSLPVMVFLGVFQDSIPSSHSFLTIFIWGLGGIYYILPSCTGGGILLLSSADRQGVERGFWKSVGLCFLLREELITFHVAVLEDSYKYCYR